MTLTHEFHKGFLWGTATAAHQVEGNNVNSDFWVLEHIPGTIVTEPSGDACDHYHRYREDIKLLAELGFKPTAFQSSGPGSSRRTACFRRPSLHTIATC